MNDFVSRALIASIALGSSHAAGQDAPYLRLIPAAQGYSSANAQAISANSRVVVGEAGVDGGFLEYHAFRWHSGGDMQILGSLYEDWNSGARAASSDGSVVVGFGDVPDKPGGVEAFRWTEQEGMIGLGDLEGGDHYSVANGVSADGRIVVGIGATDGDFGNFYARAFMWTQELGIVALDMLPGAWVSHANAISADGRVVVGGVTNASYAPEAFRWTEQDGMLGLGDLSGSSFYSDATAVSADGSVVVGWGLSDRGWEAFRWTQADGMVGLGFLEGNQSEAYAVSADGSVVVGGATTTPRSRPFIWTADEGMRNLQDVLQFELGLDLGEFVELTYATGITADGRTIVGQGFTRDGDARGWVAYLGSRCGADFDDDGTVDTRDVAAYLNVWVQRSILADWNYDAIVDTRDFIAFLNVWVKAC